MESVGGFDIFLRTIGSALQGKAQSAARMEREPYGSQRLIDKALELAMQRARTRSDFHEKKNSFCHRKKVLHELP